MKSGDKTFYADFWAAGRSATLQVYWKTISGSWAHGDIGTSKIPETWRPPVSVKQTAAKENGTGNATAVVNTDGTISYVNGGGAQPEDVFSALLTWCI